MIKNIVKQLWNEKRTNVWIAVEMAIVSALLWFIIEGLFDQYDRFHRPMGFDIENVYRITTDVLSSSAIGYVSGEGVATTRGEEILTLLSRLRRVDGVEAASATSCATPYSGCNSSTMYGVMNETDTIGFEGMFRMVSPEYFKVFRISSTDGHPLAQDKLPIYVLSQGLADSLKLSRGGLAWCMTVNGRQLSMGASTEVSYDEQLPIDICTEVRYAEPWPDVNNGYYVVSEADYMETDSPSEICIRLRPNMTEEQKNVVWEHIKEACHINNRSFFYATPFKEIREDYVRGMVDDVKMYVSYAAFLLVNIFLGVVGTFWFRTTHRRSEIGLRLALGSTRRSIFGFLIMEGLLLLALAMPVVIVVMINVAHYFMESVTVASFISITLITWILMSLMIFLGIWYPALQAMKIEPAEALHEE